MIDIALNELSFTGSAPTVLEARERMAALILLIRQLRTAGARGAVRTVSDFLQRPLTAAYRVLQWTNDQSVDMESRLFFKTLASKGPSLEALIRDLEADKDALFDFRYEAEPTFGLAYAYLNDGPCASLQGDGRFQEDPVSIIVAVLRGDDVVQEESVDVCSLSHAQQVAQRQTWLNERIQREVLDGTMLWSSAHLLFTNVQFCPEIEPQVKGLHGREPYFRQIVRHLLALDRAAQNWNGGPFTPGGVTASNESEATMQHGTYGPVRHRPCSGVVSPFRWHTKPTGGSFRIYFQPPTQQDPIVRIGYVGPHLPTVLFH